LPRDFSINLCGILSPKIKIFSAFRRYSIMRGLTWLRVFPSRSIMRSVKRLFDLAIMYVVSSLVFPSAVSVCVRGFLFINHCPGRR
jgi:hypothetical protein